MTIDNFNNPQLIQAFAAALKQNGTPASSISRKLSALNTFRKFLDQKKLLSATSQTTISLSSKPKFSFNRYFIFATLGLIILGSLYGLYTQTILKAKKELAYSTVSSPVIGSRILSFQGRLTDTAGNPIISSTDILFKLYNSEIGGTELYSSDTGNSQVVVPDENGIFTTVIGKSHGETIPSNVFTENSEVWLQISIDDETMSPRQQIATVAYAMNAETLQGLPPSASGLKNTVLVVGESGNVYLGETSPSIISTSGTFGLEGQSLLLKTSDGSGGNVTINPDAGGILDLSFEMNAPAVGGFVQAEADANMTSGNLYSGRVRSNYSNDYNFIQFQNYDLGVGDTQFTTRFSVGSSGDVFTMGKIAIGATNTNYSLNVSGPAQITSNLTVGGTPTFSSINTDTGTTALFLDSSGIITKRALGTLAFADTAVGTTYSATNGLTLGVGASNVFGLGGTLTQNTNIGVSSFGLSFLGINSNTQALYIASSGNIGIGTTTPGAKLEVSGDGADIILSDAAQGNNIVLVGGSSQGGLVRVYNESHTLTSQISGITDTVSYINNGGNVGIGYTSPAHKLDINGDLNVGTSAAVGTALSVGTTTTTASLNLSNTAIGGSSVAAFLSGNSGLVGYLDTSAWDKLASDDLTSLTAGVGITITGTGSSRTITNTGVLSVTGTANQISVAGAGGTGALTLSLPQGIGTTSDVQFRNLTIGGSLTAASLPVGVGTSIVYIDSSGVLTKGLSIGTTYAVTNGLSTISTNTFGLGGTLTQNTNIGVSSFGLSFLGVNSNTQALFIGATGYVGIGNTGPTQLFTVGPTSQFNVTAAGAVDAASSVRVRGTLDLQSNLRILNKAGTNWNVVGTRDTSGADSVLNLANIGTLTIGGNLSVGGSITATSLPVGTGTSIVYIDSSGVFTKGLLGPYDNYQSWVLANGSTYSTISAGTTLTVTAGSGIGVALSGNTLTINNTGAGTTYAAGIGLSLTPGNVFNANVGTGITTNASNQISLTTTGVTGATYGSGTSIPIFTVDNYGRITSASQTLANFESPLTFTNGLTRSTNTIGLGGTLTQNTNIGVSSFGLSFLGVNNNTQALFIGATGYVGIGTTAPLSNLDVVGGIAIGVLYSTRPAIGNTRISGEINSYSTNNPTNNSGFLRLSAGGGTSAAQKAYIDLSGYSATTEFDRNITFGIGTEAMRIMNGGNVGIGTTNPTEKLEIAGNIKLSGLSNSQNTHAHLASNYGLGLQNLANGSISTNQEILLDESGTNLNTNPRPDPAGTTTGWSCWIGSGTCTATNVADATMPGVGGRLIRLTNTGGTSQSSALISNTINTTNTQDYLVSFYAKGSIGGSLSLNFQSTSDWTAISNSSVVTLTTSWQKFVIKLTATRTDTGRVNFSKTIAASETVDVANVLEEARSYATSYFDGAMGPGYAWAGTAHNSQSTRSTGTYFGTMTSKVVQINTSGDFTSSGLASFSGTGNNYFAGNVGIGYTSPAHKLDINGDLSVGTSAAVGTALSVGTTTTTASLNLSNTAIGGSSVAAFLSGNSGLVGYLDTSAWDKLASDDLTSLTAGVGITITGTGASRTITNTGVLSVTGTANQISVAGAGGTGAITLSLPQGIGTTSSVAFNSLYLSAAGIGFSTAGAANIGTSLTVGSNLLVNSNLTIGDTINTSAPLVIGTTAATTQLSGYFTGFVAAQKFIDLDNYDKYYLDLANANGTASALSLERSGAIRFNSIYDTGWKTINNGPAMEIRSFYDAANNNGGLLLGASAIGDSNTAISWNNSLFVSAKVGANGYIGIGNTAPLGPLHLSIGNTQALFVSSSGFVGIGLTSPGYALDVNTDIFARRYLAVGTTNSNVPGIAGWAVAVQQADQGLYLNTKAPTSSSTGRALAFGVIGVGESYSRGLIYSTGAFGMGPGSATRDTFLSRLTTNTFQISSAYDGTGAANLMVNGNVGIGTTGPLSQLSVGGIGISGVGIYGNGGPYGVYGNATDGSGTGVYGNGSQGVTGNGSTTGVYGFGVTTGVYGSSSSGRGGYFTSSSGYALITETGNVGIGTTGPATKLEVNGNIALSSNTGSSRSIYITDPPLNSAGTDFYIRAGQANGMAGAGDLYLDAGAGGFLDEKILIGSQTNAIAVGIGTTAPASKLHVYDSSDAIVTIGGDSDGDSASLHLFENSTSTGGGIGLKYDGSQNDLYFSAWTGGTMATTPIMTLARTGEVGIGLDSPTVRLEVTDSSTGKVAVFTNTAVSTTPDGIQIEVGSTRPGTGNDFISFAGAVGSSIVDTIEGDGAGHTRYTGNALGTYSDRRLKENIQPYNGNALDFINSLNPVTFNFINGTNPKLTRVGYIAQEMLKIFPQAVNFGDDLSGYTEADLPTLGFDYGELTPLLAQAIKQLNTKLDDLYLTASGEVNINYNISESVLASLGYDGAKNEIEAATYSLTDSTGQIITRLAQFAQISAAKITAGLITAKNIIADNIVASRIFSKQIKSDVILTGDITATTITSDTLTTRQLISDQLTAKEATISTLYADRIISPEGNFGEVLTDKIASLRDELRQVIADRQAESTPSAILTASNSWDTAAATDSAQLSDSLAFNDLTLDGNLVIGADLTLKGKANLNSVSINSILAVGQIALKDNILETTADTLFIQPSGTGTISFLKDRLIIADTGEVTVHGNLTVKGSLIADMLTAQQIEADSAQFNQLQASVATIDKINIASMPIVALAAGDTSPSATQSASLTSNASAGVALLPAGQTELKIENPKIGSSSMIYLTPNGSTQNQVVYVKNKSVGDSLPFFTIGIDSTLPTDLPINWWIIN